MAELEGWVADCRNSVPTEGPVIFAFNEEGVAGIIYFGSYVAKPFAGKRQGEKTAVHDVVVPTST